MQKLFILFISIKKTFEITKFLNRKVCDTRKKPRIYGNNKTLNFKNLDISYTIQNHNNFQKLFIISYWTFRNGL